MSRTCQILKIQILLCQMGVVSALGVVSAHMLFSGKNLKITLARASTTSAEASGAMPRGVAPRAAFAV